MDTRSSKKIKKMEIDQDKIAKFKEKVDQMKNTLQSEEEDDSKKLEILQEALKELNIIEESVEKYYDIGEAVGSGKYGLVHEGVNRRNPDHKVAIKTINLKNVSTRYHIIAQEILVMKRVDHPSIVKIYEIYREYDKLHLVMEFVRGKELFDFIFERNRLNESEAAFIIKQMLQ